ncbi:MerR family transcriptional regulator [Microbacterium betulae]|uniref:MerR family transcriptional regulator n=1 Tax=Microbacterium betulae TaxID=2981139 RepID=A0AA97FN07_9MICO|nr:MerR family transcriptional regulator [Microbacterium sp. AB]WOF24397.1 MerR family transcriptional regulator [Microbacterium sp. AB]
MRVGELAARTGASVRSLRYYEKQGLIEPQRTSAGHRVYTADHEALVLQVQELFGAGFCSSVIQELLPALRDPEEAATFLRDALAAAEARLESEKHSIETELAGLNRLRTRLGLAPDTGVILHDGSHDSLEPAPANAFDHRDRRLR